MIDAPVLVKLDNGTIRYRYADDEQTRKDKQSRREVNHQGDERAKKHGYFFHTNLERYGQGTEWQFSNVYIAHINLKISLRHKYLYINIYSNNK